MNVNKYRFMASAATIAFGTMLLPDLALAQQLGDQPQAETAGADEGEIVVTAQRREERLRDTPISISVLGTQQLDRTSDPSMAEALVRVPAVTVRQSYLGGGIQVPIRGVATTNVIFAGASPTAYYLDSVPFGFTKTAIGPNADLYDLERIEVLRGPQGTLYGSSALNGVIRILTHPADLNEFEAKARASVSLTDGASRANFRLDSAVNVPLIEDRLAVRAVIGYQDYGGWIDNLSEENVNHSERLNARIRVDAAPTGRLSLSATFWASRASYGAPQAADEDGVRRTTLEESEESRYDAYSLRIGYDFDTFTVTSATSYIDYENNWVFDAVPSSGTFRYDGHLPAQTFAQEVVASSTGQRNFRWTLGGIYRDSQDTLSYFINGLNVAQSIDRRYSESIAVFGEATGVLLDGRLEITGGLRYFEDHARQRWISNANGGPTVPAEREATFDALTPRVVVTVKPSDRVMFYGSYSQGFRSGTFQSPTTLATDPSLFDVNPDRLTNYELGVKADLFDRRLNFEGAVYYIDWQDVQFPLGLQRQLPNGQTLGVSALLNGTSASGLGAEFAINFQPTRGLTLGGSFAWSDLTWDADTFATSGAGVRTLVYAKGDRLPQSAEYTAAGYVNYSAAVGSGLTAGFSLSANYEAGQTRAPQTWRVGEFESSDSLFTARGSLFISGGQRWTATLFVDNLTNEDGSPVRINSRPYWAIRIRPRTVGLQLEMQF